VLIILGKKRKMQSWRCWLSGYNSAC